MSTIDNRIARNIQIYKGEIWSHTYKFDDIVIRYFYKKVPIMANICHNPVSSFKYTDVTLETAMKGLIGQAYSEVKSLNIFEFEDDIHFVQKEAKCPSRLAFFYLAYYGKTWYEDRFNAKMIDPEKYKIFRQSLQFLTDPTQKPPFADFLKIIGRESLDLETEYNNSETYREFFEKIPESARYDSIHMWLNTFMEHYIEFNENGWFIDANEMAHQGGKPLPEKFRIFSYRKMSYI
jgi:hypothetical protein